MFLLGTVSVFSQDRGQRGSIPEELLRPRRDEAPRYPIDTVIGPLGQGRAPQEAYEVAKSTAAALVAGNIDVPVLSSVNRVFLEGCMSRLNTINPQFFRLGSGREEPDGSVSFLVRFVGREQGITGELFIRFEERRPQPQPAVIEPELEPEEAAGDPELEPVEEGELVEQTAEPPVQAVELVQAAESIQAAELVQAVEPVQAAAAVQAPPPYVPAEKAWLFEDLILEDARSREAENGENRHRFDFSPYERFF